MRTVALWVLGWCFAIAAVADEPVHHELTADKIVEKNVAARGGLDAWQNIHTMIWVGHIESANVAGSNLPFVLEMKRPNKTRFEIKAQNQLGLRIYDGTHGWKLRPLRNGQPELQPYSSEELKAAQDGQGIDGPLMDYKAKGVTVALEGVDQIEGRKTYRLNVKLPSGTSHHVWIDAQTFLDTKYDREATNSFGLSGRLSVFYRNYKTIDGVQVPMMIESGADTAKVSDRMVIDKMILNPPLEDGIFTRPRMARRSNGVSVEIGPTQAALSPSPLPAGIPKLDFRPGSGVMRPPK